MQKHPGEAGTHASSLTKEAADCRRCRACPLYLRATQAVFGEGPANAPLMLVGEQPGNDEDLAGRPFVGPSGKLLDALIEEAGLDRDRVYVTNAVKHFKFIERGKRRLHQKPTAIEVRACHPWLVDEIRLVRPRVVVALGSTAGLALFGPTVRVTRDRGRLLPLQDGELAGVTAGGLATLHPAAILRGIDPARRRELRATLREDLIHAARLIREGAPRATKTARG